MGDPAFVKVPVKQLASREYAAKRAKTIDANMANTKVGPGDVLENPQGNTTSFSVIDKDRNMITVTHTINSAFGALVVPEGTGILMNNQMDDFEWKPGLANSVAAGKRPLSSMSPPDFQRRQAVPCDPGFARRAAHYCRGVQRDIQRHRPRHGYSKSQRRAAFLQPQHG